MVDILSSSSRVAQLTQPACRPGQGIGIAQAGDGPTDGLRIVMGASKRPAWLGASGIHLAGRVQLARRGVAP
jgi:hypothetical protein